MSSGVSTVSARSLNPAGAAPAAAFGSQGPRTGCRCLCHKGQRLHAGKTVNQSLAIAQALRYAEELRDLYRTERLHRTRAEDSLARLEESYGTTVRALAAALDLRDDMTGGHAARVTRLALQLTDRVAPHLCSDPQLEYGFLLHDLGKIGVPDAILLKPAALDEAERREIERHPLHGER